MAKPPLSQQTLARQTRTAVAMWGGGLTVRRPGKRQHGAFGRRLQILDLTDRRDCYPRAASGSVADCGRAAISASAPLAWEVAVVLATGPDQSRPICPELLVSLSSIAVA